MASHRKYRRPSFEGLELRQMLAADLVSGELTIIGTDKNDKIGLAVDQADLVVTINSQVSRFSLADVNHLTISGGRGNDVIAIDASVMIGATINGGAGNDWIRGGSGDDTIHGDAGKDRIDGGAGDDVIFGDDGNDLLSGGSDDDTVWGGGGNDKLNGSTGDDKLSGGGGNDTLSGDDGNDSEAGDAGNDSINGGSGDDTINGGVGNDKCNGGLDDDTIDGGAGNDKLDGGGGDDRLDGGTGHDQESHGTHVDLSQALFTFLTGADGSNGRAVFVSETEESEPAKQMLLVKIEHAAPNASLDVQIDGASVGTILVDSLGNGLLKLSSCSNDDDGALPFPSGFTLHAGSTISVGAATGVFGAVAHT